MPRNIKELQIIIICTRKGCQDLYKTIQIFLVNMKFVMVSETENSYHKIQQKSNKMCKNS
jgi:hypothetical protein